MAKNDRHLFTSESVTEGHPDKIADQISDAVLDALLAEDPMSRVACETMVTTGIAFIAGEITTKAYADLPTIVRETIKARRLHARQVRLRLRDLRGDLGHPRAVARHRDGRRPRRRRRPGPDVRLRLPRDAGADAAADHAGAQAHAPALARCGATARVDYLRPDGKSQVTVEYEGDKPVRVDAVIVSTQHSNLVPIETIREDVHGEGDPGRGARGAARREDQVLHQPDRPLRRRRAAGRLRPHRAARSSSTPTAA